MDEWLKSPLPELVERDVNGLELYHGLDIYAANQLIDKSRQRHIRQAGVKDAQTRFHDELTLREWEEKGRDIYPLMSHGDLAGIVWYGEKPLPLDLPDYVNRDVLPHHTFAIRLYAKYHGKHLAKPLMDISLRDFATRLHERGEIEGFKGLWLSTNPLNERAKKLYENYGYKTVASRAEEVIMVLPVRTVVERIRALSSAG